MGKKETDLASPASRLPNQENRQFVMEGQVQFATVSFSQYSSQIDLMINNSKYKTNLKEVTEYLQDYQRLHDLKV